MKQNKEAFKMISSLVIIAISVALIMSLVYKITAPVIAENADKSLKESLNTVIKAEEFNIIDKTAEITVYEALVNGERQGVCVINKGVGYGGDIEILTGIDNSKRVTGVVILSHGETPGLGANAEKEEFRSQYNGKSFEIRVSKNQQSESEIKAISGATITSKGVTDAVNKALKAAEKY